MKILNTLVDSLVALHVAVEKQQPFCAESALTSSAHDEASHPLAGEEQARRCSLAAEVARTAQRYGERDRVNRINFLEGIRRGLAQAVWVDETLGMVSYDPQETMLYALFDGPQAHGQAANDLVDDLIDAIHQLYSLGYASPQTLKVNILAETDYQQFAQRIECFLHCEVFNVSYLNNKPLLLDQYRTRTPYVIARLDQSYASLVHHYYTTVPSIEYINDRLTHGLMCGIFIPRNAVRDADEAAVSLGEQATDVAQLAQMYSGDGQDEPCEQIAGFIGSHDEGSMGMLEIFPAYRRLGLGAVLEAWLINHELSLGHTPFAQVFTSNVASMALQEKMHMTCSTKANAWIGAI